MGLMTEENMPGQAIELVGLAANLEGALLEYVEKYGPTERALHALQLVSMWHSNSSFPASMRLQPDRKGNEA
jgi:hypothetical protein